MGTNAGGGEFTPFMQLIVDSGNALLQPYHALDELLIRISNLDHHLQRVEQQPSAAMERALKTPIEVLATDGLLKNDDLNVKILVGSCICEIARITAPEPPYEENKMRDVSDLLVTIIKSLSFVTGDAYRKASLVLAIVSRCHLFNAMWDCDEAFITEMFKEFLHLQINHADNVISEMEQIMTIILNEEAPSELIGVLLNSLKKDNENLYPVSYKLAERVFHNCADMLKQRLPNAVRFSEVVPADYSEVVARVLNVSEKIVLQDDATKEVGPSTALPLEPLKNEEAPSVRKDDARKTIIPKETSHELNSEPLHAQNSKESIGGSSSALMFNDSAQAPDIVAKQSVSREFNGPVVVDTRSANSNEESMKNNSSTILLHVSDKTKRENVFDANSPQVKDSDAETIVFEESNAERASTNIEHNKCDVATSLQQHTDLAKRGWKPNFLLKLGEGYDDLWVDSGKRSSDAAPRRRNNRKDLKGPSVSAFQDTLMGGEKFPNRKRSRKGKPRSAYHTLMEDENLNSSSSRMGSKKQRNGGVKHSGEKYLPKRLASLEEPKAPSKEFDSSSVVKRKKRALFKEDVSAKFNGEALVGRKVRVYWPKDNEFYNGSIVSYDIETSKYKVIYDDGYEEVLDLARERFELLGNDIGTDRAQISDDDTVTLYDLLKNARTSRPSTKKRKKHPIHAVNPAVLDSPGQKIELDVPTPSFSVQTSSGLCESVDPHQRQVKSSSILIRDAILKRYGDITANCLYKSQSMRESLLEVVCNVVERLKNSDVTTSDIKAMTLEISDAADAKLDVSWLQQLFVDIVKEEEAAKTVSDTRPMTTLTLTIRAAKREVEQEQIELEAAKIKLRDAKSRVEALKCVLEKIDTDLLESVAQEKSWKKRLDELLTSQG